MNAIELNHICKSFGSFAIQDLNLTVPSGTICGLVGENGAGKSTTIRLALGALRPDSGAAAGLPARLFRAARQAAGLEEFYALAKTKSCSHARLRRLAVSAFLGLTEAERPPAPLYIRVLGFRQKGQRLLRRMKTAASLPIITKPAHVKRLSPQAQALFALEARASDLYALCAPVPSPCGSDWTHTPVQC